MSASVKRQQALTTEIARMIRGASVSRSWLALILLLVAVLPAHAQAPSSTGSTKLTVGTMRVPPFVLRGDDGQWRGPSIDLWKQIAAELNTEFEFREYDYDLAGLLAAVERREIDLAVAAIPVTLETESRFDFSHPYFAAGLGIAVRTEPQLGPFRTLVGLAGPRFLGTLGALLGVLVLVGTLIWLLERRQSAGYFDARPWRGIADGVWWAAVTMTTTGYGDKVPLSWRGRALGLAWMLASIFIIALFSATMASSLVVNRLQTGITSPADLPRARVAAVAGTAGEQWLAGQGLQARTYPFVIQASKALQRGDVEALIFERPILGYMIKQYGWPELRMLPHTLAVRDYAIALPTNSPIKEPINRALLKIVHQPEWRELVQRYVGADDQSQSTDAP